MRIKQLINNDAFILMRVALTLLVAATWVSCQNDDDLSVSSHFPTDGVIRVTTEVANTRASMTSDNLYTFYMQVTHPTDDNYSYYAMMDRNNTTSPWGSYVSSNGSSLSPLQMLWKNKTDKVTIGAVAQSGVYIQQTGFNQNERYLINADQLKYKDWYLTSDLLYMAPTVVNPATDLTADGKVNITLGHLFSQLNLKVTLGTEFNTVPGTATNPITNLAINGTDIGIYFNASTNVWGDLDGDVQSITPWHEAATMYTAGEGVATSAVANYECILIPQTVVAGDFNVTFEIGDKEYIWKAPNAVTLNSGKKYDLNLTVGKDIVTAGTMSATEWTEGTGGSVETE